MARAEHKPSRFRSAPPFPADDITSWYRELTLGGHCAETRPPHDMPTCFLLREAVTAVSPFCTRGSEAQAREATRQLPCAELKGLEAEAVSLSRPGRPRPLATHSRLC